MIPRTFQPTLASPLDRTIGNQSGCVVWSPHHAVSGFCREDTSTRHIRSCGTAVDADAFLQIEVLYGGCDNTFCLFGANRRIERLNVRVREAAMSIVQPTFFVLE